MARFGTQRSSFLILTLFLVACIAGATALAFAGHDEWREEVRKKAFLGVQMKCARCHDAPTHDSTQRDLFSLAAMLNRKPLPVPKTSTIPGTPEDLANMAVKVSLKPGESIRPDWPFQELLASESASFPPSLVRNPDDAREQLPFRAIGRPQVTQAATRNLPTTHAPNAPVRCNDGTDARPNLDAAELDAYFSDGEKARVFDSMNWRSMVKGW